MQATFIPGNEINSDLGVVNAARVSLGKKSIKLNEADKKLIQYLAKNKHWTPFAHSRLYITVVWDMSEQYFFYKNINRGGFEWGTINDIDYIKGSIYSWINNVSYLPTRLQEFIILKLYEQYSISLKALLPDIPIEYFQYAVGASALTEKYVHLTAKQDAKYYKILTATLLVKVPIFVARQVRTSQVGIAYSDLYVEGESFIYNEISRRYVNDEPEFYTINKWRTRTGNNVKQGSTGIGDTYIQDFSSSTQDMAEYNASESYKVLLQSTIAPEQARCLLPQSMYTEFYMTATLHRWAQWLSLRLEEHAQEETRYIASRVLDELTNQYPDWYDQYRISELVSSYINV